MRKWRRKRRKRKRKRKRRAIRVWGVVEFVRRRRWWTKRWRWCDSGLDNNGNGISVGIGS